MYDNERILVDYKVVTGPCEFLVMYDSIFCFLIPLKVTGPCEFLVMYDT